MVCLVSAAISEGDLGTGRDRNRGRLGRGLLSSSELLMCWLALVIFSHGVCV